MRQLLAAALLALITVAAHAAGTVFDVPSREGVTTTLFWEGAPGAQGTVLLFPGGAGGFGRVEDGKATSPNFLVRSASLFFANGFNVAIFGRPSDAGAKGLSPADRMSAAHVADVAKVLAFLKQKADGPIWIAGTSRGTTSATAIAINLHDEIAAVVLTSSIVNFKAEGAVPEQALDRVRVPVLVLHHAKDACIVCQPHDVPVILRGLKNAPVKKEVMVSGGTNPSGDACEPMHWHGFVGMERDAVDLITDWIKSPTS